MRKCQHCGADLKERAKFCPVCGASAPEAAAEQCPVCGAEHRSGAKFCNHCGASFATGEAVLSVSAEAKQTEPVSAQPAQPQGEPAAAAAPAEKPVREKKAKKTEKVKSSRAGKTGIKARAFGFGLMQLVMFGLIAAVLVFTGIRIFRYSRDRFTLAESTASTEETVRQVFHDGSVSVSLQYTADDLAFRKRDIADMNVIVQNDLDESISNFSLDYVMPAGIVQTEEKHSIAITRLTPGSTRQFGVRVQQENFLDRYYHKILYLLIGAAIAEAVLLGLYILAAKSRKKALRQIAAFALAVTIALPTFVSVVTGYDQKEGKSYMVYDDNSNITGIAHEMTTTDAYQLGTGDAGEMVFTAHYSIEESLQLTVTYDLPAESAHLKWNSMSGTSGYTVYQSSDGENFDAVESLSANTYSVPVSRNSEPVYYRVSASFSEGDLYSNTAMLLVGNDSGTGEPVFFEDSDGDLLRDDLEAIFGTSTFLDDSDSDGISDTDEIALTFTDPLSYDSQESGVSDGDYDSDGDRLTNAEELAIGTNPLSEDTDHDGLTDGMEHEVFGSDPLKYDTDGDGLSDGTEMKLGTDPNSADTDNDGVSDADTVYEVSIGAEDDTDVSISVSDTGNALTVAESHDVTGTLDELDYLVSPVVSVIVADTTTGTVTLPITEEAAENSADLAVAVYNQDQNDFQIIVESEVDAENHTITAPLTDTFYHEGEAVSESGETVPLRRSVYCAFYVANWHMQFEAPLTPERADEVFFDVEFVIDESSSMEDNSKGTTNDPNRYRVQAAKNFTYGLIAGDRAAVVGFNEGARRKCALSEDMVVVRSSIDSIVGNAGGTALYSGLQNAIDELLNDSSESRGRFIIALTDGEDSGSPGDAYDVIIDTCVENEIPIYTIGLGTALNTDLLTKLALYTGGDYFHITSADDLPSVFNRIENNAFYGDDSDGDGLADSVEEYGLRDGMGNVYQTDPNSRFTDDDDMSDGEEAGNVMYTAVGDDGETVSYYIMLTDPTKADTDGDGVDDLDERLMGTLPWCPDTDQDGLTDGEECAIGYNPLIANYDNDSYKDYDEYHSGFSFEELESYLRDCPFSSAADLLLNVLVLISGGRDPYTYDLDTTEKIAAVGYGLVLGDWGDTLASCGILVQEQVNSIYYTIGSIILMLVPVGSAIGSVRDALESIINDGDFLGAAVNLLGIVPAIGAVPKVIKAVAKAIKTGWNAIESATEYAGTYTPVKLAAAPAFSYTLLRVIRMIDEQFESIDFHTLELNDMIQSQLNQGLLGLTKVNVRNWEQFISYEDFSDMTFYRASEAVGDPDTIQLSVPNTATPISLITAVRQSLGSRAGGIVTLENDRAYYRLVRAFDLECTEYQNSTTLELAIKDGIDRAAEFFDTAYPEMEKQLFVVLTDAYVSGSVYSMLGGLSGYAESRNVSLEFQLYLTSDDPSYHEEMYREAETEHNKAVIILPGISGSELVAGEDFDGNIGHTGFIKEGDNVWLPADLESLRDAVLEHITAKMTKAVVWEKLQGLDIMMKFADAITMLSMDAYGNSRYKLNGKTVYPNDLAVGAMGTGTKMYKGLLEEFGDERDVVFFSYDWRYSTQTTAEELEGFINGHHYESVMLVCHSMGGIVASNYLSRSAENRQKVEKVITVGTPYGGSPKALFTFQTGKFLDYPFVDDLFRDLAKNLPSVYELLPYQNAMENGFEYVNLLDSSGNITGYSGEDVNTLIEQKFNGRLLSKALKTEDKVYSGGQHIMNSEDIDLTIIAGTGCETINKIYVSESGDPLKIGKSLAGDGTVPLWSSILSDGTYFAHPIYLVNGVTHSALFADPDVISAVRSILRGNTASETDKFKKLDPATDRSSILIDPADFRNDHVREDIAERGAIFEAVNSTLGTIYNTVIAHCPVVLELYDQSGVPVGSVSEAGIFASEGYAECFELMNDGETKQVFVPEGFSVKVIGTASGQMDLMTASANAYGTITEASYFADIAVEENMTADVEIPSGSTAKISLAYPDESKNTKLTAENATYVKGAQTESEGKFDKRYLVLLITGAVLLLLTVLVLLTATLMSSKKAARKAAAKAASGK